VFLRLFAEFVRAQVISLTMSDGSGLVGMRGKVVELCESIVRTLGHSASDPVE
jgi:hypothetical protein